MNEALGRFQAVAEAFTREPSEKHLREMREAAQGLTQALQGTREQEHQGTDETGTVTASVNGECQVTGLAISAKAMKEHHHEALGRAVVAAVQSAAAAAGQSVRRDMETLLGVTLEPGGQVPDLAATFAKAFQEGYQRGH